MNCTVISRTRRRGKKFKSCFLSLVALNCFLKDGRPSVVEEAVVPPPVVAGAPAAAADGRPGAPGLAPVAVGLPVASADPPPPGAARAGRGGEEGTGPAGALALAGNLRRKKKKEL